MNGQKAKSVFRRSTEGAIAFRSLRPRMSRISRGQAMVEFAMISTVALMLMLVGVQYALLGQAVVAVSQGTSAIARYAVNNPGALGDNTGNGAITLTATEQQLLSASICPVGTTCPHLTATIKSYQGNSTTKDTTKPVFGDTCVISLSYDANGAGLIALPNPFLGLVSFPTTLASSVTQLYQR
jgi:Flp pilus assembly protein TadG